MRKLKTFLLTTSLTLSIALSMSSIAYAGTYTAIRGDSLWKISQIFDTTVSKLISDNNLTTTNLNIGQVLNVPCSTYSVQKGDTLYLISQKFKVSLSSLRRANNIYTDYIYIGQKLNIPAMSDVTYNSPVDTSNYSASDLDLLSRLIMAEAQGESYDAKVAVGAVVMNRVKSSSWPNSISEVIYQNINGYYQFTPVVNGWINKPANADSINAAKAALSGADPTNGAQFYYDNTTTNTWILSKPVSVVIGNMIFAY